MPVCGKIAIDRPAQIQIADDGGGTEIKYFPYCLLNPHVRHLPGAEGLHEHGDGFGDPDGETIDNDLFGTDHCPGFASAAKYIATSCMEINKDARVYDNGMITIVEIMGRHAGWLAASAALATEFGSGPDLIYLPETDFDMDKFLDDVMRIYKATGKVLVAVSEGIHYADGSFVSEAKTSATDGFGHAQLGGLASLLANIVKEKTGAKVRGIELSLLQRCGAHLASATDINEACAAGMEAVRQAVSGTTGKMVAFERQMIDGEYHCKLVLLPLADVANYEKKVPMAWITASTSSSPSL